MTLSAFCDLTSNDSTYFMTLSIFYNLSCLFLVLGIFLVSNFFPIKSTVFAKIVSVSLYSSHYFLGNKTSTYMNFREHIHFLKSFNSFSFLSKLGLISFAAKFSLFYIYITLLLYIFSIYFFFFDTNAYAIFILFYISYPLIFFPLLQNILTPFSSLISMYYRKNQINL